MSASAGARVALWLTALAANERDLAAVERGPGKMPRTLAQVRRANIVAGLIDRSVCSRVGEVDASQIVVYALASRKQQKLL